MGIFDNEFTQVLYIAAGYVITVLLAFLAYFQFKNSKTRAFYSVIWKKSTRLKPVDMMGTRAGQIVKFNPYYYKRQVDDIIREKIVSNQYVLVTGEPLAGKTRAVYQALKEQKGLDVMIPRVMDFDLEHLRIPRHFAFLRKRILLLDDINKYAARQNFEHLFRIFIENKVAIVATCRKGPELDSLKNKMDSEMANFGEPVEIPKISRELGRVVAKEAKTEMPRRFNGNIGSIFVPLDTMKDRFKNCNLYEKCMLVSIKRLFDSGIKEENEAFSVEKVKRLCREKDEIELKKFEWDEHLKILRNKDFIEVENERIRTEETYLENVIEADFTLLDNLREMMVVFSNDPDALFQIGNRAYNIGLTEIQIQIADFMKLSIEANETANKFWPVEKYPEKYAGTQNNLGNAYRTLSEVEEKSENCIKAIDAFAEALKVYTCERFPMDYAMTHNNLGNAYGTLAEVKDKAGNCKKAIDAYSEALRVSTFERFPMDYAMTQNNLGTAYRTLAEVENKEENCKKAIGAYAEALRVRTFERFPRDYAMTQNNLGNAYGILAEVKDKAENCKKAIDACAEALKVYTFEQFPMYYATIQNNLGATYQTLSEVEDKAGNCKKSIDAYAESLRVRTFERFPMDYAMTHNNLGNAYGTLAEVENKAENCKKAKEAYSEALKVYTKENFPEVYPRVLRNLNRLERFREGKG